MKTIGIIGFGSIGKVHAKTILKLGHQSVIYDPAVQGSLADIDECIALSDAVVIATPTKDHFTSALRAVAAKKHVFIEKPIGQSVLETGVMLADAQHFGLTVMCGNNMRYHPVVKVVKERMWELGGPYQGAWFLLHQEKQNAADPVILNWGAHEVDLALYLLDRKLTPAPGAVVTHDTAEFTLRFNSGPLVHFNLSYSGPNDRCFVIHGPNASIFASLDNFIVNVFSKAGREIIAVAGSHDQTYRDEMAEFLRRIDEPSTDGIGATGAEGLKCLELLLEVQKVANE